MDPSEHITDVSRRVMSVNLDRSGKTVRTASGQCFQESVEYRRLPSGSEDLAYIARMLAMFYMAICEHTRVTPDVTLTSAELVAKEAKHPADLPW
jgi:hypothetical protein